MAATSHLLLNQKPAARKIPGNFMETTGLWLLSFSNLHLKGDMQLMTSRRRKSNPSLELTDRPVTRNFTRPESPQEHLGESRPGCGPRNPDDKNLHGTMTVCS